MQKVNSDFCHENSEYLPRDYRSNWSIMGKDDKQKNPTQQLLDTERGNALSVQDVPLVCLLLCVQASYSLFAGNE